MVIEYYDNDYNYNHDNYYKNCNISGQVCAGPCVDVEGEMVCPFVKWQWDEVFVILMIIAMRMMMMTMMVADGGYGDNFVNFGSGMRSLSF